MYGIFMLNLYYCIVVESNFCQSFSQMHLLFFKGKLLSLPCSIGLYNMSYSFFVIVVRIVIVIVILTIEIVIVSAIFIVSWFVL